MTHKYYTYTLIFSDQQPNMQEQTLLMLDDVCRYSAELGLNITPDSQVECHTLVCYIFMYKNPDWF